MLIKYDYQTGKSEIVRSFSKPAKDSAIKSITKPNKPQKDQVEVDWKKAYEVENK